MNKRTININITSILLLIALIIISITILGIASAKGLLANVSLDPSEHVALSTTRLDKLTLDGKTVELRGVLLRDSLLQDALLPAVANDSLLPSLNEGSSRLLKS